MLVPIVSLMDFEREISMRIDCCILMYFIFKSPPMVTTTVFSGDLAGNGKLALEDTRRWS